MALPVSSVARVLGHAALWHSGAEKKAGSPLIRAAGKRNLGLKRGLVRSYSTNVCPRPTGHAREGGHPVLRYARVQHARRGVLDHPPSRMMTAKAPSLPQWL